MDTDRPDIFGFEQCLLVKQLPFFPGFPVGVISSFQDLLFAVVLSLILETVETICYRGKCQKGSID